MTTKSTGLTEYNGVKVGAIYHEMDGKRQRYIMCKAIYVDENNTYYGMYQFIVPKTGKVNGKSPAWLLPINNN